MLLVASGRKTATEHKSYDARLLLGGPGTRIFEMLRIAVFDATELKGFVKLTFEFRKLHCNERNAGPSKCSWWRRAGKRPQNVKVMMQD